jgi:hypothetical protein
MALGSTVSASPAGAITGEACNQPIVVARLAFGPGTVAHGQSSTARLSGRNCTRHPRTIGVAYTGTFSGNGAIGCPIIDPLRKTIKVPAASALTDAVRYTVPVACTAKRLTVSARVTDAAGRLIRVKTAELRIIQPAS